MIKASDFTDNAVGIIHMTGPKLTKLARKYGPLVADLRELILRPDTPLEADIKDMIATQLDAAQKRLDSIRHDPDNDNATMRVCRKPHPPRWALRSRTLRRSLADERMADSSLHIASAAAGWSAVVLRFAYLSVMNMFALLRLLSASDQDKDAEILVLRHQITILQRQLGTTRPQFSDSDRAFLAALLRRLPRGVPGRIRLLVRPDTVLRWHRNLMARRHTWISEDRTGSAAPSTNTSTLPDQHGWIIGTHSVGGLRPAALNTGNFGSGIVKYRILRGGRREAWIRRLSSLRTCPLPRSQTGYGGGNLPGWLRVSTPVMLRPAQLQWWPVNGTASPDGCSREQ